MYSNPALTTLVPGLLNIGELASIMQLSGSTGTAAPAVRLQPADQRRGPLQHLRQDPGQDAHLQRDWPHEFGRELVPVRPPPLPELSGPDVCQRQQQRRVQGQGGQVRGQKVCKEAGGWQMFEEEDEEE